MPDEVELKLTLTARDANTLEAAGLLTGTPTKAQQKSIYFDTSDHHLRKAGISLRIRRSGRKRVQTVKAIDTLSAGLFARREWERAVADDRPIVDATTPLPALLDHPGSTLGPVFVINVERRAWNVIESGSRIELVLDRGDVVAGDRLSPICEAELELKSGEPAALFTFARKLNAAAPVRLGVQTKAERGYALIAPAVKAHKAEPIFLSHDLTAAQAFQHIVCSCLRHFRLNEDLFLLGHSPDALHQARVALRRLRSAFSIFKALLDDGVNAGLRNGLRWLAMEIGEARSIDALLERAPPGELRDHLETARESACTRIEMILGSARVGSLMLDLAQLTTSGSLLGAAADKRVQSVGAFASDALDRFHHKVKTDGRDLAEAGDQARHEVRKDTKTLRYASEFFATLFNRKRDRRRYKHFISALQDVQDKLGLLNDMAAAPAVLAGLGPGNAAGEMDRLFPDAKEKMLDAAAEDHAALMDAARFWR